MDFKKIFRPRQYLKSIYEVDLDLLKERGIGGLLVDLDDTLLGRYMTQLPPKVLNWVTAVKASGFAIGIVSNSFTPNRVMIMARLLDVPYITTAFKPLPFAFYQSLDMLGLPPGRIAVIGDQLFTDILGGNLAGMHTILVRHMSEERSLFRRLLRGAERLFFDYRRIKPGTVW